MIPGYSENFFGIDFGKVSFRADDLTGRSAFWPAHYLSQSIDDDDILMEVFRSDLSVIREMQSALTDPDQWPVFRVPLPGRAFVKSLSYVAG